MKIKSALLLDYENLHQDKVLLNVSVSGVLLYGIIALFNFVVWNRK
jgi:hypothetical protein